MGETRALGRRERDEPFFARESPRAFLRWFVRDEFALRRSFVHELRRARESRDPALIERRLDHALRHAKQALVARTVVTALLSLGVVSTVLSTLAGVVWQPPGLTTLVDRVAAVAGSATVVLVVARLAVDRYLNLVAVTADYLAMMLASGGEGAQGRGGADAPRFPRSSTPATRT